MGALLAYFHKFLDLSNINFIGTRTLLLEVVLFMGALLAYFLKLLEVVKHQL